MPRPGYILKQTGQEVQIILDEVHDKTVYDLATQNSDGLMSSADKTKLDNMDEETGEELSIFEINELLNF